MFDLNVLKIIISHPQLKSLRTLNLSLTSRLSSAESACRRLAETVGELKGLAETSHCEVDKLRSEIVQAQIHLYEKETELAQVGSIESIYICS